VVTVAEVLAIFLACEYIVRLYCYLLIYIQLYFIKLIEEGLFNSSNANVIYILAIYMPIIRRVVHDYVWI
jgi:hypothetical protein